MNKSRIIVMAMSFLFLGHLVEAQVGANWTQVTPAAPWTVRNEPGAVAFNGKMWVLGGFGNSGNLNDVWSSSDGNSWTQVTPAAPWSPRNGFGAVVFNGKMWVLGGASGGPLNDVWSSSDGKNWTQVTPAAPWGPRDEFGVVVFNGKMWVLGGANGGYLNDVWSSSDGINWTQVTPAAQWSARNGFGAVVLNGKMWVIGGSYDGGNDVWSSSDGINWTEATPTAQWSPRRYLGAVVFHNQMWVLGGGYNSNFNDVWSSSDGANWTQVTSAAQWSPRHAFGAVVLNNQMWVLGGNVGIGCCAFTNDVWASGTQLTICDDFSTDTTASYNATNWPYAGGGATPSIIYDAANQRAIVQGVGGYGMTVMEKNGESPIPAGSDFDFTADLSVLTEFDGFLYLGDNRPIPPIGAVGTGLRFNAGNYGGHNCTLDLYVDGVDTTLLNTPYTPQTSNHLEIKRVSNVYFLYCNNILVYQQAIPALDEMALYWGMGDLVSSGPCCITAQTAFDNICVTQATSCAPAISVDGSLDPTYGAPLSIQTIDTGFGDSDYLGYTPNGPDANGSELDAAYGLIQGGNLYLFVAGNSEAIGNHINIFIDAGQPGGQNFVYIPDGSWMGSALNGSFFSPDFNANLMIDANDYYGTLYLDQYVLQSGGSANSYLGNLALTAGVGSGTLGGITIGLNNTNTGGVNGNTGTPADQTAAQAVRTGWELAIPLSLLGNPTQVKVLVMQNGFNDGYLSNQFLPGLPVGTGNVGGGGPYSGFYSSMFDLSLTPGQYFVVTARSSAPLSITCPPNITVPTDAGLCSAVLTYLTPIVTPTDVTVVCNPPSGSTFQKGTNIVNCVAADACGNVTNCSFTITVVDTQPPTISDPVATPNVLWPPNDKMVLVTVNYTTADNCGLTDCALSATSNERDNGRSDCKTDNGRGDGKRDNDRDDGKTDNDIRLISGDAHHLYLRAERSGSRSGQVYTITVTCTDASGNVTRKTAQVTVPHDKGKQ